MPARIIIITTPPLKAQPIKKRNINFSKIFINPLTDIRAPNSKLFFTCRRDLIFFEPGIVFLVFPRFDFKRGLLLSRAMQHLFLESTLPELAFIGYKSYFTVKFCTKNRLMLQIAHFLCTKEDFF